MAGYTVRIDLPDHKRGDTYQKLTFGPILINGATPESSLASCRLYFRDSTDSALGYKLVLDPGEGEGQIQISDAVNWLVIVPEQELDLDVGNWYWDFEATDSAGRILTLYDGVLTVTLDASYDD
jgi:hypothetical protein